MKKVLILCIGGFVILNSCTPRITTSISRFYAPLDYREDVRVFDLKDTVPANSEELGTVKIGDTGFSTNCSLEAVIDNARIEARKIGGNAIKITVHVPPSIMGSSCHRITAKILRIENLNAIPDLPRADIKSPESDYAVLHLYRNGGTGFLVSYDMYLGDSIICRVSNKWKKSVKISREGHNTLWARTEVKEELPLQIVLGREYYIRCGITMGAFVGRPSMVLVDEETGKMEYQSIIPGRKDKRDMVVLDSGKEIECVITSEDKDELYFTMFKNGKEIKTHMNKSQVKSIRRSE